MVPEPTEAMVIAGLRAEKSLRALTFGPALKAAIAAAPPEWLLRAALTEEELRALDWSAITCINGYLPYEEREEARTQGRLTRVLPDARAKLSPALRGGEEPCPVCGGRGWHTAGGNDPATCGRCGGGEET